MKSKRYIGAVGLGVVLLTLASAAEPGPDVQVFMPPDNALLAAGSFHVIARGQSTELVVDGKAQAWSPFAGSLRAAALRLEPGRHELRIGKQKTTVIVKDRNALKMEDYFHLHPVQPGADACSACHQTSQRQGQTVVAAVNYATCLDCHPTTQFEAKHSHPLEPLKHCGTCHAPHGSPLKGLLKAPARKLCAACHDS